MAQTDNDPIARRLRELQNVERLEALAVEVPQEASPDEHADEALTHAELAAMDD